VRVAGAINADSGMFLAEMVVASSGVVCAPSFILQALIERGLLVRLLAS